LFFWEVQKWNKIRLIRQIICKPGSVIEDVIYLGLNSHSSSSG